MIKPSSFPAAQAGSALFALDSGQPFYSMGKEKNCGGGGSNLFPMPSNIAEDAILQLMLRGIAVEQSPHESCSAMPKFYTNCSRKE